MSRNDLLKHTVGEELETSLHRGVVKGAVEMDLGPARGWLADN